MPISEKVLATVEQLKRRFPQVGKFVDTFKLKLPIIQAPMAGVDDNDLALQIAELGGLGSRGVGYSTIALMKETINQLRNQSSVCNINLFIPESEIFDCIQTENQHSIAMLEKYLQPYYQLLNIPFQPFLGFDPHLHFEEQVKLVIAEKVPILSVTFGKLSPDIINACRNNNIKIIATATTVDEARELALNGCDAIVAQGLEAGGHRGSFNPTSLEDQKETVNLVQSISNAIDVPIIAAGGIRTGKHIIECLSAGASAVQLGTSLLVCTSLQTIPPSYRQLLLESEHQDISITCAISGRNAQGVHNELFKIMQKYHDQFPQHRLPFPYPHLITAPLRAAANKQMNAAYIAAWSGKSAQPLATCSLSKLIENLIVDVV